MQPPASQTTKAPCGVCGQRCPIYTCPRCAIRTCSLSCSKSHKTLQSCSGERDKTTYVPMNKYGWGNMANDYVYLEEVGRKAAEWGHDIVKGGFLASAVVAGRGRGRGRGRGARGAPRDVGRGKRDVLKMQLDARDIDMEMLPAGMEKRRLNQSTWDVKTKSPLMTLELIFHRARDPLAPSASPTPPSFTLLTHRNNLDFTILDTIRRHIGGRGKKDTVPVWVKSLVSPAEDEENTAPVYLIAQYSVSPSHPISKAYHKLDSTQSLSVALRHKSFVEFPTIDVWEDRAFNGALVETDGTFVRSDNPPSAKRRRLDTVGGRKVIKSLLGDYKSEEEEKMEEENVLDMLGNYGSDEEPEGSAVTMKSDYEADPDSEEALVEPTLEDLRDIFEAVSQDLSEDQIPWPEGEDEEEVDWGDSAEDDAEELQQALNRQSVSPHLG